MAEKRRSRKPEAEPPSFEQALSRLEEIAARLEGGDLTLEEAIALAEEGLKLSRVCEEQLTAAEGKIRQLVERMGAVELEPLVDDGGEDEGNE